MRLPCSSALHAAQTSTLHLKPVWKKATAHWCNSVKTGRSVVEQKGVCSRRALWYQLSLYAATRYQMHPMQSAVPPPDTVCKSRAAWGFALSHASAGPLCRRVALLTARQQCIGGYQFGAASTSVQLVVARPAVRFTVCPSAALCASSCFSHVCPCPKGCCGHSPRGSGVMSVLYIVSHREEIIRPETPRKQTNQQRDRCKKLCSANYTTPRQRYTGEAATLQTQPSRRGYRCETAPAALPA